MSSVPKTNKPKYNNSDAFRWVDAQWEKFMTEQKELKSKIEDLENEIEQLKQDYYFDIRNKNLEIKSMEEKIDKRARDDEWRIEQFNRNRAPEEQVSNIQEMSDRVSDLFPEKKKYIYESPDGGKTLYRREFGKSDKEKVSE